MLDTFPSSLEIKSLSSQKCSILLAILSANPTSRIKNVGKCQKMLENVRYNTENHNICHAA